MIEGNSLAQNTLVSLKPTLAAELHLREGQYLVKQQTLNIEKSVVY
jgi:hypothetical protein